MEPPKRNESLKEAVKGVPTGFTNANTAIDWVFFTLLPMKCVQTLIIPTVEGLY